MNDDDSSSSSTNSPNLLQPSQPTVPQPLPSSSSLLERTDSNSLPTTVNVPSITSPPSVWTDSFLTSLPQVATASPIHSSAIDSTPSTSTSPTTTTTTTPSSYAFVTSPTVPTNDSFLNRTVTLPSSSLLSSSLTTTPSSSAASFYHRIFLSLRFTEAKQEATLIKAILENYYGIPTFLCDIPEGEDISDAIINAISKCELVVIFGTSTYGRKTDSSCSTYQELRYIMDKKKPYFLVKMCDEFLESYADFHLTSSISYYIWKSELSTSINSDGTVSCSVPAELIQRIISKLNNVVNGTDNTVVTSSASSTSTSGYSTRTSTNVSHSAAPISHSATLINSLTGTSVTLPPFVSVPTNNNSSSNINGTMDTVFTLTRNGSNESTLSQHRTGSSIGNNSTISVSGISTRINSMNSYTMDDINSTVSDGFYGTMNGNGNGNGLPLQLVNDLTNKLSIQPTNNPGMTTIVTGTPTVVPSLSKNRLAALEREEAAQEQSKRTLSSAAVATAIVNGSSSNSNKRSTDDSSSTVVSSTSSLSISSSSTGPTKVHSSSSTVVTPSLPSPSADTPINTLNPVDKVKNEQQLRKKLTIAQTRADLLISVCGSLEKALFESIDDNDSLVVDFICSKEGINLNTMNNDGLTPLMIACQRTTVTDNSFIDTVKVLLQRKADINFRKGNDLFGWSALCYATQTGNTVLIDELLQQPEIDIGTIELLAASGEIKKRLKEYQRRRK